MPTVTIHGNASAVLRAKQALNQAVANPPAYSPDQTCFHLYTRMDAQEAAQQLEAASFDVQTDTRSISYQRTITDIKACLR